MSSSRMKEILRELAREGWVVVSHNKHIKLRSPSGKSNLILSSSPSCVFAPRHARKEADKILERERLSNVVH